jgi:ribosomal protein S18 acetylase RimI-like enzyme
MDITEAAESHVPELVRLWTEFFDYHRDIDPYYTRSEDAHRHIERRFREKIQGSDSGVLVAVEKGEVIGYSLFWIAPNSPYIKEKHHGFISDLAVASGRRDRGVGERLLERTLAWFKAKGIGRVVLYTLPGNQRAVEFWRRHGFETRMQCMERLLEVTDDSCGSPT